MSQNAERGKQSQRRTQRTRVLKQGEGSLRESLALTHKMIMKLFNGVWTVVHGLLKL